MTPRRDSRPKNSLKIPTVLRNDLEILLETSRKLEVYNYSGRSQYPDQCCFMSTETVRTIRDVELSTATSTFTKLLSSEAVLSGKSEMRRSAYVFTCGFGQ